MTTDEPTPSQSKRLLDALGPTYKKPETDEEWEIWRAKQGKVWARLDQLGNELIEYWRLEETEGEEAARAAYPEPSVAEIADEIDELVAICEGNPRIFIGHVNLWGMYNGDDHPVCTSMYVRTCNLFGIYPPDSPAFDAELVAEGKRRGWRQRRGM